jgi:hypothetical protein
MSIIDQVKAGTGLINPLSMLSGPITILDGFTLQGLQAAAIAQAQIKDIDPPNPVDIQNMFNKITMAKDSLSQMLSHSNKISGVDLSGNGTFASIAKTMSAARSVTGELSCQSVLDAFGAVTDAAAIINEVTSVMKLVEMLVNDIDLAIQNLPSALESLANRMLQQIVADQAALANAKIELAQNMIASSLSSLFDDECAGAVLAGVMSQEMKNSIEEERKKLMAKQIKL